MVCRHQDKPVLLRRIGPRIHGIHHLSDQDIHRFDGVQIRKHKRRKPIRMTGIVGIVQMDENGMRISIIEGLDHSLRGLGSRPWIDHHIG